MKRIGYSSLAALALALGLTVAAQAQTPNPNSIVYYLGNWPNCAFSTNASGGAYPGSFYIENGILACSGGPLNSGWALSEDGVNPAMFNDNSNYTFQSDLTLTGPATPTWGGAEAGLNLNPWWSFHYGPGGIGTDGKFMVRFGNGTSTNEIACFGGRLPFYSFSAGQGVWYGALGTTVTQKVTYRSNGLSSSSPATIVYDVKVGGVWYTSGAIAFSAANPADPPPFNVGYGELLTIVGGYFQPQMDPGNLQATARGTWDQANYTNDQSIVPTKNASWGSLKALYR